MILFKRNTHWEDGTYKQELGYTHPMCNGIGVHALYSDKETSFDDFVNEHEKYAKDHLEACPSVDQLLDDLSLLIKCHFVTYRRA